MNHEKPLEGTDEKINDICSSAEVLDTGRERLVNYVEHVLDGLRETPSYISFKYDASPIHISFSATEDDPIRNFYVIKNLGLMGDVKVLWSILSTEDFVKFVGHIPKFLDGFQAKIKDAIQLQCFYEGLLFGEGEDQE